MRNKILKPSFVFVFLSKMAPPCGSYRICNLLMSYEHSTLVEESISVCHVVNSVVCVFQPKSLPKHASDTESKHVHNEKAVSRSSEQSTSEKSTKPKVNLTD